MEIKSKTSIYLSADKQQTVRNILATHGIPELDTIGDLFLYMCENWHTRPGAIADNSETEVLQQQIHVLQEENNRLTDVCKGCENSLTDVRNEYESSIQAVRQEYEKCMQDANTRYEKLHTLYEDLQTQYTAAMQEPPPAPVLTVKKKFNPLRPWENF